MREYEAERDLESDEDDIGIHVDTDLNVSNDQHSKLSSKTNPKKILQSLIKNIIGSLLIAIVVVIWVLSGETIQEVLIKQHYNKPILLTYISTSLFSIYIPLHIIYKLIKWCIKRIIKKLRPEEPSSILLEETPQKDYEGEDDEELSSILSGSTAIYVEKENEEESSKKRPSVKYIALVALLLCPLWMLSNLFYNTSLGKTTVATSTIMSSTTSLFCVFLGFIIIIDRFSFSRLFSTLFTIGGIVLIALTTTNDDTGSNNNGWGILLALGGSLFYAVYTVALKRCIGEHFETMPLLYGFIGVFNAILMLPLMLIFHYTGFEVFEVPSGKVIGLIIANGLIGTVLSDMIWGCAVALTTPIIATVGLSFTIPCAIIADIIITRVLPQYPYIIGTLMVVLGFFIANISYFYPKMIQRLDAPSCLNFSIESCIRYVINRYIRRQQPSPTEHSIHS